MAFKVNVHYGCGFYFLKEGLGMKRVLVLAAVAVFSVAGLLSAGFAVAADAPAGGGPAHRRGRWKGHEG